MSKMFAAAAAVAVALSGTVTMAASAAPAAPAAPAAGRVTPVECSNAELVASFHHTDDATSHRFGRLVLTNTSGHTCRLRGYGGLSYVGDGNGTQIGAAADRTPSRVRWVTLAPGQRAVSPVSATVAAAYPRHRCHPAHVDGFRVYVPDETASQYVPHPTTGCRNPAVHLLSHRAYRHR
jgi:Protein of unknown function (DUF4232)